MMGVNFLRATCSFYQNLFQNPKFLVPNPGFIPFCQNKLLSISILPFLHGLFFPSLLTRASNQDIFCSKDSISQLWEN